MVTGATGFLGRALAWALVDQGHEVVGVTRDAGGAAGRDGGVSRWIEADYTRDHTPADWAPRLAGIDLVINAVGIFRERGAQTFDAIHVRAPKALFAACATVGARVIQISALGADGGARSPYHVSKRTADDFLVLACPRAVIVQPSLVYSPAGASGRMFNMLASLPIVPLPGSGGQRIQPIHLDDFVSAIVGLTEGAEDGGTRVPLVGGRAVSVRGYLGTLRTSMGLGDATYVEVPPGLAHAAARLSEALPGSLVTTASLEMLERGNTASSAATRRLLGRDPRPPERFLAPGEAAAARLEATVAWLLEALRLTIAAVWIVSGIVSLGLYPVDQSYLLLAQAGITGTAASISLYGAAALDLFFGIATLVVRGRRVLWGLQAFVILLYTAIVTVALPEYWLHPFAPIVKNLPMLAALWMLWELEGRRWNT